LIETPLWSRMPEADRKALFASATERLPARRIGRPEDIANAILFLVTTPFATGSVVRVDGGGAIG
jgi:NAD(P)-dependent dehydrogenase (short-subunit alcohol dehydrogenase family)